MAIEYALYKSNLKKGSGRYTARVLKNSSANLDTIADRIVSQGTSMPRPVIITILSTFITVAERLLAQGTKIKLDGLVELAPKIQGKFRGYNDKFDPTRHQLNIAANVLRKARKHFRCYAELTKTGTILPQPVLSSFLDNATGRKNKTISPNRLGILTGSKMSFDSMSKEEGVFLIDTVTRQETKITSYAENKPSQLIFQVPNFEYASVYIEVRKRFTTNGALRKDRLPAILFNTVSKIKIIPNSKKGNRPLISNSITANKKSLQDYIITLNQPQIFTDSHRSDLNTLEESNLIRSTHNAVRTYSPFTID